MSSGLENIVRPFQTPDFTPPRVLPSGQIVSAKNVVINPGANGSVKSMSGSFDLTQTYYMIKRPTEKKRD